MSNINYGPNSSRFINGAANITTKAMLYPVGFKHVSGTQRVGTWRCPVRGCTKVNYDYKKRKGAPAPRSGHSGQCLQDFGDSTFIVVNGVQPPAPGPVVIAPAPPAAPAPAMGPQQPAAFINAQMAAFGNRLATLNANFVAANANMAGFNNQLVGVNNRLAGYDAQFQAHDASWVAHDGLLQAHDTRLDGLNNRVEELQAELEKLREKRWRTIKLWFYEVRGVYGWR